LDCKAASLIDPAEHIQDRRQHASNRLALGISLIVARFKAGPSSSSP
jgi:hypothetical protein